VSWRLLKDGPLGMVTVADVINIFVALSGFTKDLLNPVQYDNIIEKVFVILRMAIPVACDMVQL
jgi:hypothetical protein